MLRRLLGTAIAAVLVTTGASLVGVAGTDAVTLSAASATGTFADKNVNPAATPKTVTVAGLALSGADAGNYTLTQPTATANITQGMKATRPPTARTAPRTIRSTVPLFRAIANR